MEVMFGCPHLRGYSLLIRFTIQLNLSRMVNPQWSKLSHPTIVYFSPLSEKILGRSLPSRMRARTHVMAWSAMSFILFTYIIWSEPHMNLLFVNLLTNYLFVFGCKLLLLAGVLADWEVPSSSSMHLHGWPPHVSQTHYPHSHCFHMILYGY